MIYKCKRCNSFTEVKVLDSKSEEVAFAICAKCGHHDLVEEAKEERSSAQE